MKSKDRISRRVVFRNWLFVLTGPFLVIVTWLGFRLGHSRIVVLAGFEPRHDAQRNLETLLLACMVLLPSIVVLWVNLRIRNAERLRRLDQLARYAKWNRIGIVMFSILLIGVPICLLSLAQDPSIHWYHYLAIAFYLFPITPALVNHWRDLDGTLHQEIPYLSGKGSPPPRKASRRTVLAEFCLLWIFTVASIGMALSLLAKSAIAERARLSEETLRFHGETLAMRAEALSMGLAYSHSDRESSPSFKSQYVDPRTGVTASFLYYPRARDSVLRALQASIVLAAPAPWEGRRLILRGSGEVQWLDEDMFQMMGLTEVGELQDPQTILYLIE